MLDPQFRLIYFHEAIDCLREAKKCSVEQEEFWANLLGAVVCTNIASIPDSVAAALVHEAMEQEMEDQKGREHIRGKVRDAQKKSHQSS